jgi:ATP-dependent exoDNAse (exonuclease V) beta subunit
VTAIVDAPARAAAIDPTNSFCVSAPAGSGKTELLIQRYLSLLSRVQRPEQVLAITFTRKAAAEMRGRVLSALKSAQAGDPCESPHQKVTRALAEQALATGEQNSWYLLRDISRFNIKTIDSFCAGLTRQMPVLSQFGGQADVVDDATPLYAEAVAELYKLLDEDHPIAPDIAALMLHFDNNWERVQELLVLMLARREQWRDYVGVHHAPEESGAYLIATVESLVRDELASLVAILSPYQAELLELLQFAAANQSEPEPNQFPATSVSDLAGWRNLRNLLLTKGGTWRKSITKREGFPPGKGEFERRKNQLKSLLLELQQQEELEERLAAIRILPAIESDSTSWQLVLHLSRLLPMLAAQLLLVFQKHGAVDHSQVAQSTLAALGEDDAPTDLALRLDYQIEHILVDEFQDTAITQYELLHKLTRGWGEHNAQHPDAARTLMIVGDGMQSIYGFRGANVGLFLKARREGFNGVGLEHLELRCNFRSDKGVVDWVNDAFSQAFPSSNDVDRAQVRYSPATPVRTQGPATAVEMHGFDGGNARALEVEYICGEIADCVAKGQDTIAVLGRSRSHLQLIIKRLKQLHISYSAPDLDSLANSPVVADLLTVCRTLISDTDRLAWLAFLRGPWCGLTLADLLSVASWGDVPRYSSIWSAIQSVQLHELISEDGRARLRHTLPILAQARAKRDRLGLRVWVEQAWIELGGPGCIPDVDGLEDAENFLQLVEQAEEEGVGLDINWLLMKLQNRFVSAGNPDDQVHLMTLHKAKGLEFDRVIIPQLDRIPRSDGRALLLWDEHSSVEHGRSFLLAADDHSPDDAPTLYNYLRVQRQKKVLLESTRLLYVGATRAVRHLLLTFNFKCEDKTGLPLEPSRHSLLSPLWKTVQQQMKSHDADGQIAAISSVQTERQLTRLRRTENIAETTFLELESVRNAAAMPEYRDNHIDRNIGTVVHLALEQLSKRAILPTAVHDQDKQRWRMALQREGLWGESLNGALELVVSSITQSLQLEGAGRWVLSNHHVDARSEWPLTIVDGRGKVREIIIDRSFVDRETGERWLIDYKNSRPGAGESLDDFIARESAAYRDQFTCYRDALRNLVKEPLRCALFFSALGYLYPIPELD